MSTPRHILMSCLAIVALALSTAPRRASAQGSTAESLEQATKLYEDLQVERALVLLRQVISPSSPFEVSREQRVQAYTYLGASLAILGMRDSSIAYFRAALERDPFTDLDPSRFTEGERSAFGEARRRTLAVAARPLLPRRIDPRTDAIPMVIVSTHDAEVHAEVVAAGDISGVPVFDRVSEGVREISWNARLADGRIAPPGRYWLVVRARDSTGLTDSSSVAFELAHDVPALEDSLPALAAAELLAERWPRSSAYRQLAKGVAFAAGGLAVSALGNAKLRGDGRSLAGGIAVAGIAAGIAGAVDRWRHPVNDAAVEANQRRRDALAARNAAIASRNAARLALLRIVVIPSEAPE
ncbi:MAG TPA: tetratricopeptide repeat protein [Gemmatimonadaceae bacterium]|nr:tetratricopeptide repeat protein [Gemmatimonadaceae bacterium]